MGEGGARLRRLAPTDCSDGLAGFVPRHVDRIMLSGAGVFFSGATDSLVDLVRVLGAAWFGQTHNEFLQRPLKSLRQVRVNRPVFVCPCR